jgi:hypothetical protein
MQTRRSSESSKPPPARPPKPDAYKRAMSQTASMQK